MVPTKKYDRQEQVMGQLLYKNMLNAGQLLYESMLSAGQFLYESLLSVG